MNNWLANRTTAEKVAILALIVAVLGLAWSYVSTNQDQAIQLKQQFIQQQQRREDQARQDFDAKPRIHMVSWRFENGNTVVTLQNDSPITPVAIARVEFDIDDPGQLAAIARRHPRPVPGVAGDRNNQDTVVFRNGTWGNSSYTFSTDVGLNIPAGKPNDLVLRIINPKWQGYRFTGRITVYFNGEVYSPDTPTEITARGR